MRRLAVLAAILTAPVALAQTAPQLAGLSQADYVMSTNTAGTTYVLKNGKTGAVSTNTDADALLQSAVTACPTTGCTIFLAAGTYPISTYITLKDGITLDGAGPGKTIIQPTGNFAQLLYLAASSANVGNVTVRNIGFKQNSQVTTFAIGLFSTGAYKVQDVTIEGCSFDDFAKSAILAQNFDRLTIQDNVFRNTGAAASTSNWATIFAGQTGATSTQLVYSRNRVYGIGNAANTNTNGNGAVRLANKIDGVVVTGNHFEGMRRGSTAAAKTEGVFIYGDDVDNVVISGNTFRDGDSSFVSVSAVTNYAPTNFTISNNILDGYSKGASAASPAIFLAGVENASIVGNSIIKPGQSANVAIEVNTCRTATVSGNTVSGPFESDGLTGSGDTTKGIYVSGYSISVTGNSVSGNPKYCYLVGNGSNVTVSGNSARDCITDGFYCNADVGMSYLLVEANQFNDDSSDSTSQDHGILIGSNVTNSRVVNNIISGYDVSEYSWSPGSGTYRTDLEAVGITGTNPYLYLGTDATYRNQRATTVVKTFDNDSAACTGTAGGCAGGLFQVTHTGGNGAQNRDGWHFVNRQGLSGSGGDGPQTSIAVGAYQELRGGATAYPTPSYGIEAATTLYNTGTLATGFGATGTCQVENGGNGTITNCTGVFGTARVNSGGTGNMTVARGGNFGVTQAGAGTIASGVGLEVNVTDTGSGSITDAVGITLPFVTGGATTNYGINIGAISGASTHNVGLRINAISGTGAATFMLYDPDASHYNKINQANLTANIAQTIPATSGTWMLSTLTTNDVDAANAVWGASNGVVFEGSSADANEGTVASANVTADRTWTFPDATGTVMLSTLATNGPDIAASVWAESGNLAFEGATADASENRITTVDPSGDNTATLPNVTGTFLLTNIAGANAPRVLCGTSTSDPANMASAGLQITTTATVTGLEANAACACAPQVAMGNGAVFSHCYRSGTDTLTYVYASTAAIDIASHTVSYCCTEQ